jgi:hypothetical protein
MTADGAPAINFKLDGPPAGLGLPATLPVDNLCVRAYRNGLPWLGAVRSEPHHQEQCQSGRQDRS